MAISGGAVAYTAVGGLVLYSGIKGATLTDTAKAVLAGNLTVTGTQPIDFSPGTIVNSGVGAQAGGTTGSGSAGGSSGGGGSLQSGGSAQAILQRTAASFGWTGAQWQALASVEMAEAGFNPRAENPSSHAYGLAQSLGHPFAGGPASNGINEYGGFGLTPAQSRAASEGDPGPQALWMCRYIDATYHGSPEAAWAHEQADHWY